MSQPNSMTLNPSALKAEIVRLLEAASMSNLRFVYYFLSNDLKN